MVSSYREMCNKAKEQKQSPTSDTPNKLRGGQRKKKPEKEWYVVGPSRWWHLAGEGSPDGVLFKFATEDQAKSYIEKTNRSFSLRVAYTENWRVMHKEEWIAHKEDSQDPQQGT